MATNVRWKWLLLPILGVALLAGGLVEVEGGKPKPPPPPPPPPVQYGIQFWTGPAGFPYFYINKMNNLGQVVGRCWDDNGVSHGFLYDPWTDPNRALDLNTLPIAGIPDDWVIASAVGINDEGVVVGYLEPSVWDPNFRRGYVLDTSTVPWTIQLLPDDEWSYSYPLRINENGDIAGVYRNEDQTWGVFFDPAGGGRLLLGRNVNVGNRIHLNNPVGSRPAQVAGQLSDGTPFRWTTGQGLEIISGINSPSVEGINDSGTICGSTYTKMPKRILSRYPYRYNTSLEVLWSGNGWGRAINSAGDLLNPRPDVDHLYHHDWGFLNPDDLIDLTDPDAPTWFSRKRYSLHELSDRDTTTGFGTTGFGHVSGGLAHADGIATFFLLTPVPVP